MYVYSTNLNGCRASDSCMWGVWGWGERAEVEPAAPAYLLPGEVYAGGTHAAWAANGVVPPRHGVVCVLHVSPVTRVEADCATLHDWPKYGTLGRTEPVTRVE